jgi:prepilin-type N-terminal cleavage/methylation domain-containing protein
MKTDRYHATLNARNAFTLMEIIVAMSIGVVILLALYMCLNIQLSSSEAARDGIEESALGHALCRKLEDDISRALGAPDAARMISISTASSSSTSSSTSTASTTPATGGTGKTTATQTGTNSWTVLDADGVATSLITFNLPVQGTSDALIIYIARSPRIYLTSGGSGPTSLAPRTNNQSTSQGSDNPDSGQATQSTDIRQIIYRVDTTDDGVTGLVRQEVLMNQADDGTGLMLNNLGGDVPFKMLAPEVQSVQFRYLDYNTSNGNNGWVTDWPVDATDYTTGAIPPYSNNGTAPIGPPLAIEVTLTFVPHSSDGNRSVQPVTYRHVISILGANGPSLNYLGQQLTNGGNSNAVVPDDAGGAP